MGSSDSFAVELGKGEQAVSWMNEYAKKNKLKFEAKLGNYSIQSIKFGAFVPISWKGDWPTARNLIKKASDKLHIKTIEAGFHDKKDMLIAVFGSTEYGKVYAGGHIIGQVELKSKRGKWIIKSESYF